MVTQITLILGLLPFFGGKFEVGRYRASSISILTIFMLAIGAVLVADGFLSRLDATLLLLTWIGATAFAITAVIRGGLRRIDRITITKGETIESIRDHGISRRHRARRHDARKDRAHDAQS